MSRLRVAGQFAENWNDHAMPRSLPVVSSQNAQRHCSRIYLIYDRELRAATSVISWKNKGEITWYLILSSVKFGPLGCCLGPAVEACQNRGCLLACLRLNRKISFIPELRPAIWLSHPVFLFVYRAEYRGCASRLSPLFGFEAEFRWLEKRVRDLAGQIFLE